MTPPGLDALKRALSAEGWRSFDDLSAIDVVDEFNGPQIVFGTLDGERVFGVAVDEDDSGERWIFAPVSPLEERALRDGVASPREALRKESARIVDFLRDRAGLRVVPVSGELLSDDELPTAEARLGQVTLVCDLDDLSVVDEFNGPQIVFGTLDVGVAVEDSK